MGKIAHRTIFYDRPVAMPGSSTIFRIQSSIEPFLQLDMGSSTHLLAKRAFIFVILALARAYQLIVDVNRDSDDVPILKAFRRVA